MKTLFLKQIRKAALCLAVTAIVGYGLNTVRPATIPASHAVPAHTLLADDGQETHHGKGHLIQIRHIA